MGFLRDLAELMSRYAKEGPPRYLMAAIVGIIVGLMVFMIVQSVFWIIPRAFDV